MSLFMSVKSFFGRNELQDIDRLRLKGVKIGSNCEIYRDVNFGSEPYLIDIGNHVRITRGCKLITHDGGGMGYTPT